MKYNPETHHRRSIRLKGYDYSQAGAYYVTICAWNGGHVFGKIVNSEREFSPIGTIIQQEWCNIPVRFPQVELDTYIIMPNHLHGIIIANYVGAQFIAPNRNQGVINHAPTLGNIVRAFKARCTYTINQIRETPGMPVWQRNYFEHVIRNEYELHRIREYIINNPVRWEEDEYNPENLKCDQENGGHYEK